MPPIMFFSNFPISYARWASTPMIYQQCNCDNGNNKWLNWWMMSEMVKNIGQMFRKPEKQPPIPYAYNPYQQYVNPYQTMYPYVNLNNTQQYPLTEQDEGLRDLQEAYKNCKTKFNFVKVNDKYIAIDKDGKRLKADTVEELMDLIDAKVDGKGGLKPEEEVPPAEEVPPPVGEGNDPPTDPPTDPPENKRGIVPQGWHKDNGFLNAKKRGNHTMGQYMLMLRKDVDVAKETVDLLKTYHKLDINEKNSVSLRQALIDANPSIFDKDGKLLDGVNRETLNTKLDVPTAEILKSTFGATEKAQTNTVREYPQTQAVQEAAKKLHEGLGFLTTDVDDIEEILFDGNKFNSNNCVAVAMAYQNQSAAGNSLLGDIQRDTYLKASAVKIYLQKIASKFVIRANQTVTNSEHRKIVNDYYNFVKNEEEISTSKNWKERVKVWEIMKAYETGNTQNLDKKLKEIDDANSENGYMRK